MHFLTRYWVMSVMDSRQWVMIVTNFIQGKYIGIRKQNQ